MLALAHGNLFGAALAIAAVALIAMLLASLRAPSTAEDVDESLDRRSGFHIFGPDEDEEPLVHVPVFSTRVPPTPPRPANLQEPAPDEASRALDRIAAFAVRQPFVPAAPETPEAPAPEPAVRWTELPPLQPTVAVEPEALRSELQLPLDGDILLVEDDSAIADMYRLLLHTCGYASRRAYDGVEGIAMVREERPALILLDMMMPRMDGIQFLEALRSWPKTSDIPVVVLTNTQNQHLADRAMALGAVEYLVKAQTRPQVLARALPHWLRGNRALSAVS